MRHTHLLLPCLLLLLTACAQTQTPDANSRTELLLEAHSQQIGQLQEHVRRLEHQIAQLQQKTNTTPRPRTTSPSTANKQPTAAQILAAAQNHHRQQQHNQALQQLNQLERHNPNNEQSAQSLYLRVQIHASQNNCESLIISGQQLVQRFPRHAHSADALLRIGQCQWQMQQRDIARDTWRRLIHSHPQSPAAAQARQRLADRSP